MRRLIYQSKSNEQPENCKSIDGNGRVSVCVLEIEQKKRNENTRRRNDGSVAVYACVPRPFSVIQLDLTKLSISIAYGQPRGERVRFELIFSEPKK